MGEATNQRHESLVSGYSGRLFLTLTFITLTGSVGRLVLAPFLPRIIADLGITRSAAGVGLTILWGCTAVTQFPGGRFSDDLSRKTVLVFGLCANVVGFLLLAATNSYGGFLAALAVVGVGTGLFIPAKYLVLTDLFVDRRGRAFGLNSAAAETGGVVAAGVAVVILGGGWRLAFLPIALVLATGAVAIHTWSQEGYRIARPRLDVRGTARRLTGSRQLLGLLLLFSLISFVWQGVTGFLPDFLHVQKGLSETLASYVFAGLFITAAVITPLAGSLGDRLGHARVALATPLFAAAGLGLLIVAQTTPLLLIGVAVLAAGLGSFWPLSYAYLMDALPESDMGGDFGATRTVFMGLGSVGPAYVGITVDLVGYSLAFGGFIVCLLAGAILLTSTRPSRNETSSRSSEEHA